MKVISLKKTPEKNTGKKHRQINVSSSKFTIGSVSDHRLNLRPDF